MSNGTGSDMCQCVGKVVPESISARLAGSITDGTCADCGDFRRGENKGEAIAAEIAISKRVQNLGLQIAEVGPYPFWCFNHAGWK